MRYSALIIVIASLLQVSCAPSPFFIREPKGDEETLVIGRVQLLNQHYKAGSVPIGTFNRNVKLEFEDVVTRRKLTSKAVDERGFFFLYNPTGSRLRLVRFSYHNSVSQPDYHPKAGKKKKSALKDKGATIAMTPRAKKIYEIEAGKVNNLGYLEWTANMQSRTHHITFNQQYVETRDSFAERYPESQWNEKVWVTVKGEDQ